MIPSLSVRIAEHPRQKDRTVMPFPVLAGSARAEGFAALSLRASVIGVDADAPRRRAVRAVLEQHGLAVSMVTGDLPLATNGAGATRAIHGITPYLDLAEALGATLLRVMVHADGDIAALQRSADEAAERGMRLAQQCHWGSLAETVTAAAALMRAVDRDNVGITFEPANLMACGDDFGAAAVRRLAPWLFNVYFQNLRLRDDSPVRFATRVRGPVGVEFLPLGDPRGIDPRAMIAGLDEVGYAGTFTLHQPCLPGQDVNDAVADAGRFAAALL